MLAHSFHNTAESIDFSFQVIEFAIGVCFVSDAIVMALYFKSETFPIKKAKTSKTTEKIVYSKPQWIFIWIPFWFSSFHCFSFQFSFYKTEQVNGIIEFLLKWNRTKHLGWGFHFCWPFKFLALPFKPIIRLCVSLICWKGWDWLTDSVIKAVKFL